MYKKLLTNNLLILSWFCLPETAQAIEGIIGTCYEKFMKTESYAQFADRHHQGSILEAFQAYRQEKTTFLDENGNLKEELIGMEGLARYAEESHEGDIEKAYYRAAFILEPPLLQQLGWEKPGDPHQYPMGINWGNLEHLLKNNNLL